MVKRTLDTLDTVPKALRNDVKQLLHNANAGVQVTTAQHFLLLIVDIFFATEQDSDEAGVRASGNEARIIKAWTHAPPKDVSPNMQLTLY